jgi:hypothetical protein
MTDIPVARNIHTSYENFVAECPWCGKENIFNRASDLKTFEPIGGLNVVCQSTNCQKDFRIAGDSVNCSHEMLVFDCHELIDRKHYMNCILILAQAYEIFLSLYLRVELVYKPFAADTNKDIADLNRFLNTLQEKIKHYTFDDLRTIFLQHIT